MIVWTARRWGSISHASGLEPHHQCTYLVTPTGPFRNNVMWAAVCWQACIQTWISSGASHWKRWAAEHSGAFVALCLKAPYIVTTATRADAGWWCLNTQIQSDHSQLTAQTICLKDLLWETNLTRLQSEQSLNSLKNLIWIFICICGIMICIT